MKDAQADC